MTVLLQHDLANFTSACGIDMPPPPPPFAVEYLSGVLTSPTFFFFLLCGNNTEPTKEGPRAGPNMYRLESQNILLRARIPR